MEELRAHVDRLEKQMNVLRAITALLAIGWLVSVFYPSFRPQQAGPGQVRPGAVAVSGGQGSYGGGNRTGAYYGMIREVVRTRRLEIYDSKNNKLMVVSAGDSTSPTLVMKKDKSLALFGLKPDGNAYISMTGAGGRKQWISTDGSDASGVPSVESVWRTPRMPVASQQPVAGGR